jgi:hypothetical protein
MPKQKRTPAFTPSNDSYPTLITLSEWHGEERIDVRTFYTTDAGLRRPTKKGVSIPLEQLQEFLTNLHDSDDRIADVMDAWVAASAQEIL